MRFKARLGKHFKISSQLESERFHPGLQIHLNSSEVFLVERPNMDQQGVLLNNARAIANVLLEFRDGAKVRFSLYPIILNAGSMLERSVQAAKVAEPIAA